MGLSTTHLLLLLLVVILLFGSSKISTLMGDVAKGIKSFKKGLEEEDTEKKSISSSHGLEKKAGKEGTQSREKE